MGIVSLLCTLYFGFSVFLLFVRGKSNNVYLTFGALTFILILLYGSLSGLQSGWQSLNTFLIFSLLLLLFGMMNGMIAIFLKLPIRLSVTFAITLTVLLMLFLFNSKGFVIYLYIPVLLFSVLKKLPILMKVKKAT